ncbi:MAG: class I SAM-dependent methyltransferase [Candidatus Sericytochromatia bacterium]|nr:class I SAM-dependent methyltransferase [Candidatus Sericytochromatia bacterium]
MRHHLHRMHEAVLRSAPIRPGDKILYVGSCNPAFTPGLADQLARSGDLVAIDFSAASLPRAERLLQQASQKNMLFFKLDEVAIPYPEAHFDLVIVFGASEQFPDGDHVLDELGRVLKAEGRLYWHDVGRASVSWWERLVRLLSLGRWPARPSRSVAEIRRRMSRSFIIEFHRRWTHTWGKQSCLLVGRKGMPD